MFANHFDDDGDGEVNLAAHPLLQRVPKTCLDPDRSFLPVEAPKDHNGCAGLLLVKTMIIWRTMPMAVTMMILNTDLPVDRAECGKCSHAPEYVLL